MESLLAAQKKWERQNGLEKTIEDVQSLIDNLTRARNEIADSSTEPAIALAKIKKPMKESFDRLNKDAKELHTSITNYGKLLDKKFRPMRIPQASIELFKTHGHLTNRAIGMHFLREGLFDVATTFVEEATTVKGEIRAKDRSRFWQLNSEVSRRGQEQQHDHSDDEDEEMDEGGDDDGEEEDDLYSVATRTSQTNADLQSRFAEMYEILHALRNQRALGPAIAWAKAHSEALEARGSNLEFELCRLRFIELYHGHDRETPAEAMVTDDDDDDDEHHLQQQPAGPLRALEYARATFPSFPARYFRDTARLMGSLAFSGSIGTSPYGGTAVGGGDGGGAGWEQVADGFTREFCGLLGLSERSPLHTAATAGGLALPVLVKLERVMGEVGGQWTSANELPVEIPLPPPYLFHSIFVCPVSKEQSTDANPPMLMPCGHVIAKESLGKISRGSKFKCPYCPGESHPRDAIKVYL